MEEVPEQNEEDLEFELDEFFKQGGLVDLDAPHKNDEMDTLMGK